MLSRGGLEDFLTRTGLGYLADPGKARGCSTNTVPIPFLVFKGTPAIWQQCLSAQHPKCAKVCQIGRQVQQLKYLLFVFLAVCGVNFTKNIINNTAQTTQEVPDTPELTLSPNLVKMAQNLPYPKKLPTKNSLNCRT